MADQGKGGPTADRETAAPEAAVDSRRRAALLRLGKTAGYAAPVTVAMLNMKTMAAS